MGMASWSDGRESLLPGDCVTNADLGADLGSLGFRMRSVTEDQVANKSARMQARSKVCTLGLSCLRLGVTVHV